MNLHFISSIGALEFFQRFICHDFDMKPMGDVKMDFKMLIGFCNYK